MPEFVIPAPPQASVAVQGSEARFPVRRIFCIGRNYGAHAREMGHSDREPPFFFLKPADALVDDGGTVPFPPLTSELHFEVEMVVALGAGGADVAPEAALGLVWGAGVGIDLTRRDLQQVAKDARRPWDEGKGFDHGAPCGPLRPIANVSSLEEGRVWLDVNGETRQDGNLTELIWPVADLIAHVSRSMRLEAGDLIYTGTPAGVGPCAAGDVLKGYVEGVGSVEVTIG